VGIDVIRNAWWIAKGVGLENVPRRIRQALVTRAGLINRLMAPHRYSTDHLSVVRRGDDEVRRVWQDRAKRFIPIPTQEALQSLVPSTIWDQQVTEDCRRALGGEYPFFSRWQGQLGWPPKFNHDPVNQIDWPVGELWPRYTRSGPPRNDLKLVWEPSRLTLAYFFARQYRYSAEERWAEAYWELFDAWAAQNPVNQSVAWGCGQEVAFRLMAMLTGAIATLGSAAATPTRLRRLETLCWQFGKRIAANINYALSQKNNHGLSEAAGLWTVGLLFPEFPESPRWQKRGMQILQWEVQRQVYDDGAFVQHSMAYHRVMLDDLLWVLCLAHRNSLPIPPSLMDRFRKATVWLGEFVDLDSGRVPNLGANDGANVLPLSCGDYLDYRPTWEAAARVAGIPTLLPRRGPWSEKSLWLTGRIPEPEQIPAPRSAHWSSPIGGYHLLRGPSSYAMLRAVTYRDRPGQCDMLHLDLWHRGQNLLRDAGSFRYYHEEADLKRYFSSVEAHNTVQVDGRPQMRKGPNFLWFDWPRGRAEFSGDAELHGEATFGRRPTEWKHCRKVKRIEDSYEIRDSFTGGREFTLRWRLTPDVAWQQVGEATYVATFSDWEARISVKSDATQTISLTEGWESLYYGERRAIFVLEVRGTAKEITTRVDITPREPGASG
jgi:hypothetical protein